MKYGFVLPWILLRIHSRCFGDHNVYFGMFTKLLLIRTISKDHLVSLVALGQVFRIFERRGSREEGDG